ncbi:MAG TPA: ATP-dependent RNA helicase HrpA [Candidatus Didemnitutus sp.]|nr:ATP-dependent RNA helicase HrpA [Candidatus Didemnitutus sp.]
MPSRPKRPPSFRIEFPPELPISARADEIIGFLQRHQVLVLAGETGSGKTTQIPKMCLAAGSGTRGRIACTQPRRVAASSVSRRVAEELNVAWGREVGCKIRFADQTSPETVVKFMTDGMLLAELHGDPDLREYDTIIVDEAHERSLNIDFILGHLRRLRVRRPDLRIVITSATIDTAAFAAAFDGAPVIEVSGRMYPVEVIYAPPADLTDKREEVTYLDATVEAVRRVLHESAEGDVLVFLPTERDIREACGALESVARGRIELVPLFGRLTNSEQQRVFAPTPARKVVVSTNIAETSLTIPGIRFVIDSGLARISHYTSQSRTRRLPVEPIAQSSADQRKGRCGRVSNGVCIRLYSEQDFLDRPKFAQPEIQRCNLADVILRMKAFGLGAIEEFPFLNAPPARGVRAGYALLEELGALSSRRSEEIAAASEAGNPVERDLTPLGAEMAHLPVDPTVARMILQAREEKAMREVLVIASGLTVQDPRERPIDEQSKADAAHRRFTHPDSDFLTLLAIWEAYHDEFEKLSLGQLRRFCQKHYLSFLRMREWRDVHAQLVDVLSGRDGFALTSVHDGVPEGRRESRADVAEREMRFGSHSYRSIHRSILSGLLGNVAVRGHEGDFLATHDRRIAIFPGSALHEKSSPVQKSATKPKGARWLMAAEIVETARMFARTCARIDPRWAVELGQHLLRVSHSEPFWSAEAGRVLVKEKCRLYNLEVESRSVGYGRFAPRAATEIFIREGLVGDTVTWPFEFLAHNRQVRAEVEARLTRLRSASFLNLDELAYRFYARQLAAAVGEAPGEPAIASVPELIDFVRRGKGEAALRMTAEDLSPAPADESLTEAFPETLALDNRVLPLGYAYKPGSAEDGVTVRVTAEELGRLDPATLDWAVPGHVGEKVELLLKALPKELRRQLIPFAQAAREIASRLALLAGRRPPPTLAAALAEILTDRLGVRVDPRFFAAKPMPDHLRVRVEVVDASGATLAADRDLEALRTQLGTRQLAASRDAARGDKTSAGAWADARRKWETLPAGDWKFGDLPEVVKVAERDGVAVQAWPGLQAFAAGVAVRLFASPEEAKSATRAGLAALFQSRLKYEIGWLEKDLRDLRQLGAAAATLAPLADLQADALDAIVRWVCGRELTRLHADEFAKKIEEEKRDLRGLVPRLLGWLREILALRTDLQTLKDPPPGAAAELDELLPPDFLRRIPFDRLEQIPRYLKGRSLRAGRWRRDPAKDAQRAAELAPFVEAGRRLGSAAGDFGWLVEEFRVSLFAQELGTAEPVSAVRLQRALERIDPNARSVPAPRAAPSATLPTGKKTVLRSLDALGNLKR